MYFVNSYAGSTGRPSKAKDSARMSGPSLGRRNSVNADLARSSGGANFLIALDFSPALKLIQRDSRVSKYKHEWQTLLPSGRELRNGVNQRRSGAYKQRINHAYSNT